MGGGNSPTNVARIDLSGRVSPSSQSPRRKTLPPKNFAQNGISGGPGSPEHIYQQNKEKILNALKAN